MIKMKRLLSIILCLAMLLCSLSVFSACVDEDENVEETEKEKIVSSISVDYTPGEVYATTTLDELKSSIVVTLNYDDGTKETVTDYTLSGTLTEGTSIITVKYKNFEKPFFVDVSGELNSSHKHTLTRFEAKESTCTEYGNIEYWSCAECGKYYSDRDGIKEITFSETVLGVSHRLVHHENRDAACRVDGNIEYWSCSVCNKNFSNSNATVEAENIVIKAAHTGGTEIRNEKAPTESEEGYTGDTYCKGCGEKIANGETIGKLDHTHEMIKTDRKDETCTKAGNIEYWSCSACGKYYADEEGLNEISLAETVIAASHKLTHYEAKDATCTEDGNVEYWHCYVCNNNYSNESATIGIVNTVIPAVAHELTHYEEKEATCKEAGNIEYWSCSKCNKYYADEEGIREITLADTVIPAEHTGDTEIRNEKAPTESEEGYTGDTYCKGCGDKLKDGHTLEKLDHTHEMIKTDSTEASCTEDGNIEYWTCSKCEKYYADEEGIREITLADTVIAASHNFTHNEAKDATCTEAGNIEYWSCSECNKYYADEKGDTEITLEETVIPAVAHELTHYEEKEATCKEAGNIEYWSCSGCEKYYKDAEGISEITLAETVIPAVSHELTHYEANEAICIKAGNIEYWSCSGCEKYYKDANGNIEITFVDTVIPAPHTSQYCEEIKATCTTDGSKEYWFCSSCFKFYADEKGNNEIDPDDLKIAASHDLTHHEKREETCTDRGSVEFWHCGVCNKDFLDAECNNEVSNFLDLIILPSHKPSYNEAKPETCTENGNIEYWSCDACDKLFEDAKCVYETTLEETVIPAAHKLIHYEEKAATCLEDGHIEYWHCSVCDKNYSDSEANTEVDNLVTTTDLHIYATEWTTTNKYYHWHEILCGHEDAPSDRAEHSFVDEICTVCGGKQIFETPGLKFTLNGDMESYNVTGFDTATDKDVVIPSTFNGLPVVGVGDNAFNGYKAMSSIKFPEAIKTIGSSAFLGCSSLTEIELPENLVTIGDSAFKGCTSLTEIVVPDSVTSIGFAAFSGCSSLTSITLPFVGGSEKSSGDTYQYPLGYIFGTNSYDGATATTQYYYGKDTTSKTNTTYYIPTSLTNVTITGGNILYGAFYNCNLLSNITIGDDVAYIASFSFYGCSSLTKLTIPFVGDSVRPLDDTYKYPLGYIFGTSTYTGAIATQQYYYDGGTSSKEITYYIPKTLKSVTVTGGNILFGAFYNCKKLTEIKMPETITKIGNSAFCYCESLTSVNIPESVTSIGNYAFYECTGLLSITIPENVTTIGNSVFYNCEALTSIYFNATAMNDLKSGNLLFCLAGANEKEIEVLIGANVTKIPAYLFCSKFDSSYVSYIAKVAFEENSVCESIGEAAFSDCSSLVSIEIPSSVKTLGKYAFYNCYKLTDVYIYDLESWCNLTFSSDGFYRSNNPMTYASNLYLNGELLTDIVIPESITSIGEYTFFGCENITSITIHKDVTSIGNYAFANCSNLEEIIFNATALEDFTSSNYVFYDTGSNAEGIEVSIGANVTKIPAYLFRPYSSLPPNIVSVVFEENSVCESVGAYAFGDCNNLVSINLPESLTTVGNYAFYNCLGLISIVIPKNVTSIGENVLSGCSSLTDITLPFVGDSVKTSSDMNQYPLGYIFGTKSYIGGVELAQKYYHNSTISTTERTYYIPENLTSVTITGGNILYGAFYNCSNLTTIILGDSVNEIVSGSFEGCANLTDIGIGKNVTKIASSTFEKISTLTSVHVTDLGAWCKIEFANISVNPLSRGAKMYINGELVTELDLQDSEITKIERYAFYGYSPLVSITIPESVTSIGSYAFYNCVGLEEIFYNAESVGDFSSSNNVFYCAGQAGEGISVIFGEGVKKIPAYLFYISEEAYTPYIVSVEFAEDCVCTSIGGYAFYNGKNISSIILPDDTVTIGNYSFYNCSAITNLSLGNSVKTIGNYAFYSCSGFESLEIPNSTTFIGSYAFYLCKGIKSLEISNSVTSIGDYVFLGCSSIESLEIPNSVTSIGNYAFFGCSSIESLEIPDSVTSIGEAAFRGCYGIKDLTIGKGVTSIGTHAFVDCTSVESIDFNATAMNDLATDNYVFSYIGKDTAGVELTIGKNVTKIPAYLFGDSYSPNIKTVRFEEDSACTSIGSSAFLDCSKLDAVYITDLSKWFGITFGNSSANPLYRASNLYLNNELVTILQVPDTVTTINAYAFYDCTSLIKVIIPDNVKSINSSAFYGCYKLIEVYNLSNLAITAGSKSYGYVGYYAKNVYTETEAASKLIIDKDGYVFYCDSENDEYLLVGYIGEKTDLILPTSVNGHDYEIYQYAFYNNISIESVTISNGVKNIGNYAFYNCDKLESVTISDSVKKIGNNVFDGCDSLKNVTIGDGVESIGNNAFASCTNLEYNDLGNAYYLGNDNNPHLVLIKVKDTAIDSCEIYEDTRLIYYHAFYNCESLTEIEIPDNVIEIGAYAFYNCESLTEIEIPDNVIAIGDYAFYNCNNLATLEIGSGVQSIGAYAFEYCDSLTNITIPDGVTDMGSGAFGYCEALEKIIFNATEMNDLSGGAFYYAGEGGDGIEVIIGANVTKIPAYLFYGSSSSSAPKIISVEFEEGSVCTSIGVCAFENCGFLTNITIPDGVTSIGNYAFHSCTGFKSITIPENVSSIGKYAFYGCTALEEIYFNAKALEDFTSNNYVFYNAGVNGEGIKLIIGSGVTKIPAYFLYPSSSSTSSLPKIISIEFAENSSCKIIGDYAFYTCEGLESIVMPEDVTEIGNYAFYNCTNLTEIVLPNNLTSIGASAFRSCSNLSKINIPDSIQTIGNNAFDNCTNLIYNESDYAYYLGNESNPYVVFVKVKDTTGATCQIDSNTKVIYYQAFDNCKNLYEIIIPNGVRSIGGYAFYNCVGLEAITIPDSVVSIGSYAFDDCNNLNAVYITDIADWCGISFGNSYANPLYYAENMYLKGELVTGTILLPNTVTSIGQYAFYNYDKLTWLIVPDSVKSIGSYAFDDCSGLMFVTIGDGIESIGSYAFDSCSNLKAVYITDIADWCGISFGNYSANPLYYAGNLYIDNELITTLRIPDAVNSIGAYAFYGCKSIVSVMIGKNVESIGSSAFYNCNKLIEIYNRSSIDITLGNSNNGYVGYYAKNLYTETEGASKFIDKDGYVFYCDSESGEYYLLGYIGNDKALTLPSDINGNDYAIYKYAFYNRTDITSIVIPDSLTEIVDYAFYGCNNVKSLTIGKGVTKIGSYAFYGCTALEEINFNATSMSDLNSYNYVFYNAGINGDGIKVVIGANVTRIPAYLFSPYSYYDGLPKVISVEFAENSECVEIGASAFAYCRYISSFVIPDSVKTIGSNAFYECVALTSVTIGESVESIGNSAFYGCSSLYSIVIPDSVKTIGSNAFYECAALISVTIGKSVESIGSSAFYNCYKLIEVYNRSSKLEITIESTNNGYVGYYAKNIFTVEGGGKIVHQDGYVFSHDSVAGKYYLIGYTGSLSVLVLPESINGSSYTIYKYAFFENTKITKVIISDGVDGIDAYAFYGCSNLSSVEFGKNVTTIGEYAFYQCNKLSELNIPEKVTTIGNYAFYGCIELKNLTIGEGVTNIGSYAFYDCTGITNIVIPNSVTEIGAYAFYGCIGLKSLTIGEGVTNIGSYAFYNCTALEEINFNAISMSDLDSYNYVFYNAGKNGNGIKVVIGASVINVPAYLFNPYSSTSYLPKITSIEFVENSSCETIGDSAFYNCNGIETLTLPDSLKTIGAYAFYNSVNLSTLIFGSSLESIGDRAFYCCKLVTSISLPETLTSIGAYAFSDCGITSLVIPENVTTVGSGAFANCSSLSGVKWNAINCPEAGTSISPIFSGSPISSITFGDKVEVIPAYLCKGCMELMSVTIPQSVTSIGTEAFYKCYKLVEIYNLSKIEIVLGEDTNGYVGYYAYSLQDEESTDASCIKVTEDGFVFVDTGDTLCLVDYTGTASEITLPSCENRNYWINRYAFYNNSDLTKVTMPNNVISIDEYAFYNCKNITEITMSESITTIGDRAFYYCSGLTSITLPDTVTSIGDSAFYYCSGLKNITLPDTVTSIGDYVFYNCSGLTSITLPDTVTSIGNYAFYYCSGLTSITLSDNLTSIGDSAFYGCRKLTEIVVPKSVTTIGSAAFGYCGSLQSITLPFVGASLDATEASASTLFGYIFGTGSYTGGVSTKQYYSSKYQSYYIPSSLKEVTILGGNIYYGAFYGCANLKTIKIMEGVKSIDIYAFRDCTGLSALYYNAENCADFGSSINAFYNAGTAGDGIAVTIGANAKSIPAYMFHTYNNSYSPKILSVEFEDGSVCEKIGAYAFYGCANITSITISETVTSIGKYAFCGCANITSITIPENVTYIGTYAFSGCTALREINYNAVACANFDYDDYIFCNCGTAGKGIVVTIGAAVKSIPSYFLYVGSSNTVNVVSINFAEGSVCETIGAYAFYNSKITGINLPDSLTTIGNYVFYGCSGLRSVVIGNNVKAIGIGAFRDCVSLESATFSITSYWSIRYSSSSGGTGLSSSDLSDASIAARYLKGYYNYYWTRS